MSTDLPALPAPDLKVDLNRDLNQVEKAGLRAHAMEYVVDDRFSRPLPRFLTELPWAGSNEAITDRIAAQLLTAPDPDKMPDDDGTIAFQKLVGHTVTVYDIAVMEGDKPGGWAGYLLMDVTVDDDPEHIVANTGAKEAVMRLAIAWARDEFPLTGRPTEKPLKNTSGNRPVMFLAEKDFFQDGNGQQVGA